MQRKIGKILVANRGEIAVRIMKTCIRLGIRTVCAHSSADRESPAARMADECVEIGPPEAAKSYLDFEKITQACLKTGADAVHPGYGFLSENTNFADHLAKSGIIFIGPTPDSIRSMGDKIESRRLVEKHGVPVVPGYDGDNQDEEALAKEAARIGYPVMVKASAGGGGKGMRRVDAPGSFVEALRSAKREAKSAFGDDRMLLEKYVEAPRHIEIQVFGDEHGNLVHIFERECSIQRRHQKIIEESPSPAITPEIREQMAQAALKAAGTVKYRGAGTVEFIYSDKTKTFYFLEMNTRLQVEHPVTEMVTGLDLVEEQIRVASGLPLSFSQKDLKQTGHAIEARLYAESPVKGFLPAIGPVHRFDPPQIEGIRVDSGIASGGEVSIYYDPMFAKIIAHGPDRASAIAQLDRALKETVFFGPDNNIDFLRAVLTHPKFKAGQFTTDFIAENLTPFRGLPSSPDDLEAARTIAGLLFFHGAKSAQQFHERNAVSAQGGDLAPWHELENFQLWG